MAVPGSTVWISGGPNFLNDGAIATFVSGSTVSFFGNVSFISAPTFSGGANFTGPITFTQTATFDAYATFGNSVTCQAAFVASGSFVVTCLAQFFDDANIAGDLAVAGQLVVSGSGGLVLANTSGGITIQGGGLTINSGDTNAGVLNVSDVATFTGDVSITEKVGFFNTPATFQFTGYFQINDLSGGAVEQFIIPIGAGNTYQAGDMTAVKSGLASLASAVNFIMRCLNHYGLLDV